LAKNEPEIITLSSSFDGRVAKIKSLLDDLRGPETEFDGDQFSGYDYEIAERQTDVLGGNTPVSTYLRRVPKTL
jgi:hypothetical protein